MYYEHDEEYMCPFCVTPWKCNGPHIEPEHLELFNRYVDDIVEARVAHGKKSRKIHDRLCNIYEKTCCPWMGECECQCNCEFIEEVRNDEREAIISYLEMQLHYGLATTLDKVLFDES